MDTEGAVQVAEAIGRRAAGMQDALTGVKLPPRGQPHAGVAASAVARCRSIVDQIVALSAEAANQLRVYESSMRRGRRLAALRAAAQPAVPAAKKSKESADDGDELEGNEWEIEWNDDL